MVSGSLSLLMRRDVLSVDLMAALSNPTGKIALILTTLVGFAAGAGVGYLAGNQRSAIAPQTPEISAIPAANPGVISPAAGPSAVPGAPATESASALEPITAEEFLEEIENAQNGAWGNMKAMRRWADLNDRLLISNPAEIAAKLQAMGMKPGQEMSWNLVMAAYSEKDPQGAWNFALAMPAGQSRQSALMAIISTVAGQDPTRALSMADSIEDQQLKRQMRSMAIMNIAQKDPRRALELATTSGSEDMEDHSISMIFHQWARKDPEGAKVAFSQLTGRNADQARMSLISSLAQSDPKAAWQFANSLPASSMGQMDPRQQVIQTWAQSDPQAALKAALEIQETGSRASAISAAVSSWARSDFQGALQYAINVPDSTMRSDVLRAMSMNPAGNRQELLDAVFEHMPTGDNFQQSVSQIMSSWAREDPAAAAAAAAQLPPGRIFSQSVSLIASQWSQTGRKEEVFAWAKTLPEGEARTGALGSLFSQWSTQDPQAAIAALGSLAPGDRNQAIRSISSGWSNKNPEAVLQWSASLPNAEERRDVIRDAVSQWANSAPEAAASYVRGLGEEDRGPAMRAVVDRWASKDAEAAAEWLAVQPAGSSKDSAITALARKISSEDPETAISWAATISDPKNRDRQIENLARDWMRQDAATAKAWISSSNLSQEIKTRLQDSNSGSRQSNTRN